MTTDPGTHEFEYLVAAPFVVRGRFEGSVADFSFDEWARANLGSVREQLAEQAGAIEPGEFDHFAEESVIDGRDAVTAIEEARDASDRPEAVTATIGEQLEELSEDHGDDWGPDPVSPER